MIYISTNCLGGKSFVFVRNVFRVLKVYEGLGIKNIELGSVHLGKVDVSKLKKYKQKNGANFIIHGFFPPEKKGYILNLASQDQTTTKKTLKFMKNTIEVCNEIEADLYSFHPGYSSEVDSKFDALGEPNAYGRSFETAIQNIQILADHASYYNIKLAVENQNALQEATKLFCKTEEFKKLLRTVNNKNLGLLLDVGHLHFASKIIKFDKNEFIESLKHRVFEMHIQKPGKEWDDHLKLDRATAQEALEPFRGLFNKIKLTLESVNLTQKDILDCKRILESTIKKI